MSLSKKKANKIFYRCVKFFFILNSLFLRGISVPLRTYPENTPFIVGLKSYWRNIFFNYVDSFPSFIMQMYILMKKLNQSYTDIMKMNRKDRISLVKFELEVMKKEDGK
jgi:hypothetical protein